jgi:hypothetical protein
MLAHIQPIMPTIKYMDLLAPQTPLITEDKKNDILKKVIYRKRSSDLNNKWEILPRLIM